MKLGLLAGLCCLLMVLAGTAAGMHVLGLYSDQAGNYCDLIDTMNLIEVYVVHQAPGGAIGVQFAAPVPSCAATWIYLSTDYSFICPIAGCPNPAEGALFGYPECTSGSIMVCRINFLGSGLSGECCQYPLQPDPASSAGRIEAFECDGTPVPVTTVPAVINMTANCPCQQVVPVEETSWGRIKSLYRQ